MQMENPATAEHDSAIELKPKMKFTGTVMKTTLAGAVVDIGVGKAAVIHVSQIESPNNLPIKSVKDVLSEGQSIDVWIRKVKEERIELTMFKPLDLDWRDIKKRFGSKRESSSHRAIRCFSGYRRGKTWTDSYQ